MKKEVNLLAIAGIVLLVVLLAVAAIILTQCGSQAPEPTDPVVTEPTEAETQPTETEEPTEPPHVHEYVETVTDPDCISDGYTTFDCACGDSYIGAETEALGHSWVDATCTEPKTCSACGVTEGRAKDHVWDEGKVVKEPVEGWEGKPGEDGEMLHTCTVCGETKTVAIPSPDHVHDYTAKEVVTPPTCTEDGFTTHYCRCDATEMDSIVPAFGHTWNDATCTTPKVCSVCGTTDGKALGHIWFDATCTTAKTCDRCKETIGAPLGHKETTVKGYAETCTEAGLTDGIQCSRCKIWLKEQTVIPAKGHKDKTVKGKDPTCTETGLTEGIQCSVCNEWLKEQEAIPALGHKEEEVKGYDSTCTATGLTDGKKCTVCQEWTLKQTTIEIIPHTEVIIPGYAATCTNTGLTDGKQCSVCKKITLKQTTIGIIPHTEVTVTGYPATCTNTGLTDGKQCSVCYKMTVPQETIAKIPHTEEIIKGYDSTCTATGLTDGKKCTECYTWTVKQETIPFKKHIEVIIPAKAATCTATGLTEGKKCSVCGTILVAQKTIDILPHTEVTIPGKGATTTEPGLTEGRKCSVCGKIIVAQQTIPMVKGSATIGYRYGSDRKIAREGGSFNEWAYPDMNRDALKALGYTKLQVTIEFDCKRHGGEVTAPILGIQNHNGTKLFYHEFNIIPKDWYIDNSVTFTLNLDDLNQSCDFLICWGVIYIQYLAWGSDGWSIGETDVFITAIK